MYEINDDKKCVLPVRESRQRSGPQLPRCMRSQVRD